ncbi:MAG: glycosyltransferase [Candidatus Gastranaerophilales bacterium]|nr:glycosyltransferase [Candidatus Gastranaerophilales bacterium]
MQKILVTMPISIAGCLIMRGFAKAFRQLGFFVEKKDIREITREYIDYYKPDYIIGYDYGYLVNQNLADSLKNTNFNFIHYFADVPQENFALSQNPDLYQKLKNTDNKVFIWDKSYIQDFKNCNYLPLAVDASLYKSSFNGYQHKISFVGRPLTGKRQNILIDIIKHFGPISIFSYEPHFEKSVAEIEKSNTMTKEELQWYKESFKGFVKTEEEMAEIYNSSAINLNITIQGKNNINYRVFEVLASSGFLLTDEMKDISKYFEVGRELETYKDTKDLIDKIEFYLQNRNIAQAIARAGRKNVVNNHTFKERAKKMFDIGKKK